MLNYCANCFGKNRFLFLIIGTKGTQGKYYLKAPQLKPVSFKQLKMFLKFVRHPWAWKRLYIFSLFYTKRIVKTLLKAFRRRERRYHARIYLFFILYRKWLLWFFYVRTSPKESIFLFLKKMIKIVPELVCHLC